jgi:tetratricopeptide (TPR) repeat protein
MGLLIGFVVSAAVAASTWAPLFERSGALLEAEQFQAAADTARLALAAAENQFGATSDQYVMTLDKLSRALFYLHDFGQGIPLSERALALCERQYGRNSRQYATALHNLGIILYAHDELSRAESLFTDALTITEHVYGARSEEHAKSMHDLAKLYHKRKQFDKEGALIERALRIYESSVGKEHLSYAQALFVYGEYLYAVGKFDLSVAAFKQAMGIADKNKGPGDRYNMVFASKLAATYQGMGRTKEALDLKLATLDKLIAKIGEKHPYAAQEKHEIGVLYSAMGNYAEAGRYLTSAFAIRKESLGASHPSSVETLRRLIAAYVLDGKCETARDLLSQACTAPAK